MKRPALIIAVAFLTLAALAGSQNQGVRSVIGNVFLQDSSPGTPQTGHAAIKGTFRAGQIFATSPSTIIPVVGNNTSSDNGAIGASFTSAAPSGIGVRSTATRSTQLGIGVQGESRSSTGIGVRGLSKFIGVFGDADGTAPNGAGVWGRSAAVGVPGLIGENSQAGGVAGVFKGSVRVNYPSNSVALVIDLFTNGIGASLSAPTSGPTLGLQVATGGAFSGLAVNDSVGFRKAAVEVNAQSQGVVTATIKNFVEPNPDNPKEDIVYACIEGPEAAMYTRGTVRLHGGRAHVAMPEHFSALAAPVGVTVVLTPGSGASKGLGWENKSVHGFDIVELGSGRGDYDVDWEVKAVRKGFEDYKVVRPWTDRLDPKADKDQAYAARLREMHLQNRP